MTASPSSWGELQPIPSGRRVRGRLTPPPSKSITHRYLNLALLSRRATVIQDPLLAEDTRLFLAALHKLGFAVEEAPGEVRLRPPGSPPGGGEIFCGNAGTMFRFLTATLTVVPGDWRLDGIPRLRQRPVGPLVAALEQLGARLEYQGQEGFAPLRVWGNSLRGGRARLDAGVSSQFLSALLMAAQGAREATLVEVEALTSSPYVDLTREAVEAFGGWIRPLNGGGFEIRPSSLGAEGLRVEGDYSAACYPAAAAALTGGEVTLEGLRADSRQGDRWFLELLESMGARVEWGPEGPTVRGGHLQGLEVDLASMPDQVPTLAALAPFAQGVTRIRNVSHLRVKESDRLAAMAQELRRLGAEAEVTRDGLLIPGIWAEAAPPRNPVVVNPHGDHRIAMSLALVGLRRPGVAIARPEVVAKSYPGFWDDLERLLW